MLYWKKGQIIGKYIFGNFFSICSQKTLAQLESIQEQLKEAIHERDETRAQLYVVQESSEQHQEALTRLQNVLHDFQKNQTREINLATEREKRKLGEEKKRNTELELQLRMANVRTF